MLNNELKDLYLKVYTIKKSTNDIKYSDLLNFLELANNQRKEYSVGDLITKMALTYAKKTEPQFELNSTFNKTFQTFLDIYARKQAYEIDTWLKIKGIELSELEANINLTKKALWDIRKGYSRPTYDSIVDICNNLGITFDELKLPPRISRPKRRKN